MITVLPVHGIPIVETIEDLWNSLTEKLRGRIQDDDVLVIAHTPFSRVEGPIFKIEEIEPSDEALRLARELDKDPKKVEIILRCSNEVIKVGNGVIITRNRAGIICANGGVDQSNAGIGYALGIPADPDALARRVRNHIEDNLGVTPAVIISDTVGRALRIGAVNIAIGVAGIQPLLSKVGTHDLFGYEMRVTVTAIADELASAAELVQGQTDEGIPAVIIRGYKFDRAEDVSAKVLNRPDEKRLFR